jgi:predicted RNA-binding Zn ribbon-like protein
MAEPGETPASLRLVEDFLNTRSVELGTDDVGTPAALGEWLRDRGLLTAGSPVGPDDLRRAVRLREGVRALVAAHQGELPATPDPGDGLDPAALADLDGLARGLALVVDVTNDPPCLAPAAPGTVDAAFAAVLAAIADAAADGSWARFKVCREPGCRWAYYDHSRNRSRAWCSMETCGNRAKARAFRNRAR